MKRDDTKFEQDQPSDGVSRREWLLNFGSAVILSGFAGMPGESQQTEHAIARELPPGLYTPSIDHVTHALNQDGLVLSVPPGAETEFVRPRSGPFIPQAFSSEEFAIIRRLVELILGEDLKTVPGQTVTGGPENPYDEVAEWIDLVVTNGPRVRAAARNLTAEQRSLAVAYFNTEEPVRALEIFEPERVCKEGLAWLRHETRLKSFATFLAVPSEVQLEVVSSISDNRLDPAVSHAGTKLFDFLKAEVIRGYYTSRPGLKELNYKGNSFYGQSPGCGHQSSSEDTSHNPDA